MAVDIHESHLFFVIARCQSAVFRKALKVAQYEHTVADSQHPPTSTGTNFTEHSKPAAGNILSHKVFLPSRLFHWR
jgi:hypothetical protein